MKAGTTGAGKGGHSDAGKIFAEIDMAERFSRSQRSWLSDVCIPSVTRAVFAPSSCATCQTLSFLKSAIGNDYGPGADDHRRFHSGDIDKPHGLTVVPAFTGTCSIRPYRHR